MVVEWLRYEVPSDLHAAFLEADARCWTPVLAAQPGFVDKAVWREPAQGDALTLVIRWTSLAAWKAVPQATLEGADRDFLAALGRSFVLLESRSFELG